MFVRGRQNKDRTIDMPNTMCGIGTKHFGRYNFAENEDRETEEFDTTLWFSLFWLPIIPLKSYRIRQQIWYVRNDQNLPTASVDSGFWIFSWGHPFTIIQQYNVNWMQVAKTYLLVYGLLIIIPIIVSLIRSL